jgi:WD40 repeat protein
LQFVQDQGKGGATAPAVAASPLDSLDPEKIPAGFRWRDQPKELVGVIGERDYGAVNGLAFSPDGKFLASRGPDHVIVLWELPTGRKHAVLQGHRDTIKALSFSPDGKTLASGSDDQTIRLWDLAPLNLNAREVLTAHSGFVNALAFSPDGKLLASGSSDQTVRLWDLSGPKAQARGQSLKGHTNPVYSVAFAPDGKLLVSGGSDQTIRLWNVANGTEVGKYERHISSINALAFTSDGKTLASGSSDQTIILWKRSGNRLEVESTLRGQGAYVFALAFARGDRALASADNGGGVIVWEIPSGAKQFQWQIPGRVYSVAYAPDGRYVGVGSGDGLVYILRTASR